MSLTKPRTMPGVLELLPLDQIAFQEMLDNIRAGFERYGFLPIETPAIELTNVLLTKSGGETERQVYFVQSTGSLQKGGDPELALRFDLTVPLARYVAEHEHKLTFPFRRYQMQRVYRGESAQRGRFREFYQCDVDIIGKDSLSPRFDAELVAVIDQVFQALKVGPFQVRINHRMLMRGLLEHLGVGADEQQTLVMREVDKLDKRGADYVRGSLAGEAIGLSGESIAQLLEFVSYRSTGVEEALAKLESLPSSNDALQQGVSELREVLTLLRAFGVPESHYAWDCAIARGLDYYTGTVYETVLTEHLEIGSVCSGGRYENLASNYTKSKLPGVGISIGATRLYWQLREAGLIDTGRSSVAVLVTQMDPDLFDEYAKLASMLRAAGINTELQLESSKLGKQLKYASKAGIPFAVIVGPDEHAKGVVQVKDLTRQEQFEVTKDELIASLRVEIEQFRAMALTPSSESES